jgi:hypothetical protein
MTTPDEHPQKKAKRFLAIKMKAKLLAKRIKQNHKKLKKLLKN